MENLKTAVAAAIDQALDHLPDRNLDLDREALDDLYEALMKAHEALARL